MLPSRRSIRIRLRALPMFSPRYNVADRAVFHWLWIQSLGVPGAENRDHFGFIALRKLRGPFPARGIPFREQLCICHGLTLAIISVAGQRSSEALDRTFGVDRLLRRTPSRQTLRSPTSRGNCSPLRSACRRLYTADFRQLGATPTPDDRQVGRSIRRPGPLNRGAPDRPRQAHAR
jgi:hypothetical protein